MHCAVIVLGDVEVVMSQFLSTSSGDCSEEYLEDFDVTSEIISDMCSLSKIYGKEKPHYLDFTELPAIEQVEEYIKAEGYFNRKVESNIHGYVVYESLNPNGICDWWSLGGRFSDRVVHTSGARGNTCNIKNIDWDSSTIVGTKILSYGSYMQELPVPYPEVKEETPRLKQLCMEECLSVAQLIEKDKERYICERKSQVMERIKKMEECLSCIEGTLPEETIFERAELLLSELSYLKAIRSSLQEGISVSIVDIHY